MSASVLTNSSAMVALQTLRTTNSSLQDINSQISTGKKVATAKDSAAVFAISKIMESDVTGFKALEESLSLGQSTVAVASSAASSIGDLLNDIKGKIVSANEDNVDRAALQNEITSLRDQITSIVDSAQFNGLNLIDGSNTTFNVLSSLNRDASGNVSTGQVTLNTANSNLNSVAGLDLDNFDGGAGAAVTAVASAGTDQSATPGGFDNTGRQVIASAATYAVTIAAVTAGGSDGNGAGALSLENAAAADLTAQSLIEGDVVSLAIGSTTANYVVRVNDQDADIVAGLRAALTDSGVDTTQFQIESAGGDLEITNNGPLEVRVDVSATRGSGGLAALAGVDVSTAGGASTALGTIDVLIQSSTDAQAALGTVEKRLDIQSDFTSKLIDSFKSGIGALVDADLEEASARLQALQVQQQLGIQALSIANQAPQNILSLFR